MAASNGARSSQPPPAGYSHSAVEAHAVIAGDESLDLDKAGVASHAVQDRIGEQEINPVEAVFCGMLQKINHVFPFSHSSKGPSTPWLKRLSGKPKKKN